MLQNDRPTICEWPNDERPREKLFKYGEKHLTNSELLAILLRTGTQGQSALDLARKVIQTFKTFRHMSDTSLDEWTHFKGLGQAKLAQIKAALEIGRRFREETASQSRRKISSSRDAADIFIPRMRDLKNEVFRVMYLDAQNRIIDICDETEGTVNLANPIIREIFKKALQKFSAAIICAHNHPSGLCRPSREDERFTRLLCEGGKILGVKVLDHLIIGDNTYHSFADEGKIY